MSNEKISNDEIVSVIVKTVKTVSAIVTAISEIWLKQNEEKVTEKSREKQDQDEQ